MSWSDLHRARRRLGWPEFERGPLHLRWVLAPVRRGVVGDRSQLLRAHRPRDAWGIMAHLKMARQTFTPNDDDARREPRSTLLIPATTIDQPISKRRTWAFVILYGLTVNFSAIAGREITGRDETRVAGIAREIALSGDFIVPRLNGEPFLEYPPLGYIPMAIALHVADAPSAFAAHVPGAILALATALLTLRLGNELLGFRVARAAPFLVLAMPAAFGPMRLATVDTALVSCMTLTVTGIVLGLRRIPRARAWAAAGWLGAGLGFLVKGPIGPAIPLVVVCTYAITRHRRPDWLRAGLLWGPFIAATPIVLWWAIAVRRGHEEIFEEILRQSITRFVSQRADHAAPFFFYLLPVLYKTAPLTILVLVVFTVRRRARRKARTPAPKADLALPLLWLSLTFACLSFASAKRHLYLAPIAPSAALISASLWSRLRACTRHPSRIEAFALGAFALFVLASRAFPILGRDRDDSLRAPFECVAKQKPEAQVVLFKPSEALRGAATFYRGATSPIARTPKELRQSIGTGPCVVVIAELLPGDTIPSHNTVTTTTLAAFPFGRSRIVIQAYTS